MRLPRDASGRDLVRALESFGYVVVRQSGSHIRLSMSAQPQHSLTIPDHESLRVGTLAAVIAEVAAHHGISREEVVRRLFGDR
jgi:predicted RNA binding protein YcfA (HicA-like mRNA interferase family)